MKIVLIALTILASTAELAHAAPNSFKSCKSDIVTEVFESCPGGEGGSRTACGSKVTKWGSLSADMTVDSEKQTASATLVYVAVSGAVTKTNTACKLGDDQWMNCETTKSVPSLGHLTISFNISGIAPGVYFADIFADASNVPVGGFQNTDTDCQR
jgi:hypothetical protein